MTDKKHILNKQESAHLTFEQVSMIDQEKPQVILEKILQSTPDPMVMVNQQGKIFFINDQAEKTFGYQKNEILGEYIEILIPESYRKKHAEHVRHYFLHPYARPMGAGINLYAERKNKEIFPVEISISPIALKNKLIAMAAVRDISERKKTQAKVDELNKQIINSAKRAGMAEVANSISHHLGNVLNNVNISAESLCHQADQSPYIKKLKRLLDLINEKKSEFGNFFLNDEKGKLIPEYLKIIIESLETDYEKMHQIKSALQKQLSFAIDIVSKQQLLSESSVFLEPVLPIEIVKFAIKIDEIKNIEVNFNSDVDDSFFINTDKMKLIQIVSSLIMNAKEALLKTSSVDKRITISIKKSDDNSIQIEIRDNGIGISEENLKRLFSFGFSTNDKKYGFGLHNSYLLAKELGGAIYANSDGYNKGAIFIISLPS